MARYHINPETGEPGVCKATDKCRFGDATTHYATEGEARSSYEESMASQEFSRISFKPGEIQVDELPESILVDEAKAVLPPGVYFVGDPCYSAGQDDDAWQEWVAVADEQSRGFTLPVAGATYNGYPVVGVNTMYGDGAYPASNGYNYGVDAGMVGAVPKELLEKMGVKEETLKGLGTWETFGEPVELTYSDDGTISIGSIAIYTGDEEMDEPTEDEELYLEDYEEEELL